MAGQLPVSEAAHSGSDRVVVLGASDLLKCEAALASIWRDAWASANPWAAGSVLPLEHWIDRVRGEFGLPNVTTLVYQRDGLAIGFAVVDVGEAYLHQLHVAPHAQGAGIGKALLAEVAQLCPDGWALHVALANTRAQACYVREGLVAGPTSVNPDTGRERILYSWRPAG